MIRPHRDHPTVRTALLAACLWACGGPRATVRRVSGGPAPVPSVQSSVAPHPPIPHSGLAAAASDGGWDGASTPRSRDAVSVPDAADGAPGRTEMGHIPANEILLFETEATSDSRKKTVISAFEIDRTEVTVTQYSRCVNQGACSKPESFDAKSDAHMQCNWGRPGHANHPVNCVSWPQADTYCSWVHKRLPTSAEWELAARGTDGRKEPWGFAERDLPIPYTWQAPRVRHGRTCAGRTEAERKIENGTCEVGSHPGDSSPFGVFDMCGNVGELTSTPFELYIEERDELQRGRVSRGRDWTVDDELALYCAVVSLMGDEKLTWDSVGFRCAR